MFFLSIIIVLISSYLILSSIKQEEKEKGKTDFLYFLLIAFSQLILSFEILSLLKFISVSGILLCNFIFLIISIILFVRNRKRLSISLQEIKHIFKIVKRDKALIFLSICFILFLILQLIKIFCFQIDFGDALSYYLTRCTSWIQQGSIMHFVTPDSREPIMPVNMDFLYTWMLLFTKNETGLGIFSFIGFIGGVYVLYNLLRELNFSIKRSLWAVFVFSSFALVIIEITTPCSDLFTGALILSSVYLFIKSVKSNNKTALFFSSLSFAVTFGVKITAIIAAPVVFLIFLIIGYIYKKDWKYLCQFGMLLFINFIIFSSYNYILNTIEFHNPFSCNEQFLLNEFKGGIKGYIANVIKYIFAIFDMSGMPSFINLNGLVEYLQFLVLNLFGTTIQEGTSKYFLGYFVFNNKMTIIESALGVMGLIVFLPSLIYTLKRFIKKRNNKTAIVMFLLAVSTILNILIFSRVMVFTSYNLRYLLTLVLISVPVVVYSYPSKKLCKIILCTIIFIYMIISVHQQPVSYIIQCFKENKIVKLRENNEETAVYNYFIQKPPVKIALIAEQNKNPMYYIEKLKLFNFSMEKILIENIEDYKLEKYNYIITAKEDTASNYVVKFKERMTNPDKYIAKCLYSDNKPTPIYDIAENKIPVYVECDVPYQYLKEKGFKKDESFKSAKYTILYRN